MPSDPLKYSLPLLKIKFEFDIMELFSEQQKFLYTQENSNTLNNNQLIIELLYKIKSLKTELDQLIQKISPNSKFDEIIFIKKDLETTINTAKLEIKKRNNFNKIYSALNQSTPLRSSIAKQIFDFIWSLSNRIAISEVILFGSQANGTSHLWSDIDIAVISQEFENESKFYRKSFLTRIAISTNATKIQAVGYSVSEWSSNRLEGFVRIVKNTGISILSFPEK